MMRAAAVAVGLALVVALPFAARSLRPDAAERCALNGVRVDPRYAVRVVDEATGVSRRFCCPSCAETWIAREPAAARRVFVVDESSGAEVDARSAWFVESLVVAVPATDSHIHSFATEAAARRHAQEFTGVVLEGDERPFRLAGQGERTR